MTPFATLRRRAGLLVCVAGLAASTARALERVTLRSGFTVDCAHHEVFGDRVRLFMSDGGGYQDIFAVQVANIEFLPDPPKPIVLPKPTSVASAANASSSMSSHGLPSEADLRGLLARAGAEHNIDVELLASVIHAESGYNVRAVSRAGARGLMQLMPETARTFGAHDAFKADENIAAGTAFLDEMLKRYNDNLALALAAYNAGPGAVERYHGVPPFRETRAYVTRVITEFYKRKIALGAQASGAAATAQPTLASSRKPVATAAFSPMTVQAALPPSY